MMSQERKITTGRRLPFVLLYNNTMYTKCIRGSPGRQNLNTVGKKDSAPENTSPISRKVQHQQATTWINFAITGLYSSLTFQKNK